MDSNTHRDMFSSLPDVIVIMIISSLTFKEGIRTSVLSKRWRNLCHETRNISFKESEYVDHSVSNYYSRRASFVRYMIDWVSRFQGQFIETFELCFPVPAGFEAEMETLIAFAVSRKVKNLSLDFSNPTWRNTGHARWSDVILQLPSCFYNLKTLESLKLYACGFDPSEFENPGLPRSFSIGWVPLRKFQRLISKSPLLEILSIRYCWGMTHLIGNMREILCENCDFPLLNCTFDLPKVDVFTYIGEIFPHYFKRMSPIMENVFLDFGAEPEYDVPTQSTIVDGETLSGFLNSLRAARTLTLCPYLLQAIQECEHPHYELRPVQTQHLVLRIKMQPKEFKGIRLLLENCPDLITLTLEILPPKRYYTLEALTYGGINRQTYWLREVPDTSLPRKLKVVVVRNFRGSFNEVNMLKFLIRSGRGRWFGYEHETVLERIELYLVKKEVLNIRGREAAEMLSRIAGPIQVIIHNP